LPASGRSKPGVWDDLCFSPVVGNLYKNSLNERGWKIWRAYLAAYCFLTAAIIYQAGRAYKKEKKNRGIFSESSCQSLHLSRLFK
jgi:hypothetical protein